MTATSRRRRRPPGRSRDRRERLGDGVDDRQAEAGAAVARARVGLDEAVEDVREQRVGNPRPWSRTRSRRRREIGRHRGQLDGSGPVAQGVGQHVVQDLREPVGVGEHDRTAHDADLDRRPAARVAGGGLLEEVLHVDRFGAQGQATLVGAGEQQQVVGEAGQPARVRGGLVEDGVELLRGVPRARTSSLVRRTLIGVRSSWLASLTIRRSRSSAPASLARRSFSVRLRRSSSSPVPGSGRRSERSVSLIMAARARMRSTGRRAATATWWPATPASRSAPGNAISSRIASRERPLHGARAAPR